MKSKFTIIFPLLTLTLISCDKNDDSKIDSESPVISILAPVNSIVYKSNTNLPVKAQIVENDQLHEIRVEIYNIGDSTLVFSTHIHKHSRNVIYETSMFLPELDSVEQYEVKLLASDHVGNTGEESIVVEVRNE